MVYHLASNRALAEQFGRSDAAGQARIIGQIEALIGGSAQRAPTSRGPARPARPVTRVPDPITPVSGGGGATTVQPEKMSFSEYKAWRARGGGR